MNLFSFEKNFLELELKYTEPKPLQDLPYEYEKEKNSRCCILFGASKAYFLENFSQLNKIYLFEQEKGSVKAFYEALKEEEKKKLVLLSEYSAFLSLAKKLTYQPKILGFLKNFEPLVEAFKQLIENEKIQFFHLQEQFIPILKNISFHLKNVDPFKIHLSGSNETICIVGAGPSLKNSIDFIKNHHQKITVIACLRSLNVLLDEKIYPDFIAVLDPKECLHFKDEHLKKIPCFATLQANKEQLTFFEKVCFIPQHFTHQVLDWIDQKIHKGEEKIDPGHHVVTFMLSLAIKWQFSQIVLIGTDLCFHNENKYGFENSIKHSRTIFLIDKEGNKVKTQNDFLLSKYWMEEKIKEHPEISFVNLSKGLKIENFSETIQPLLIRKKTEAVYENWSYGPLYPIKDQLNFLLKQNKQHPLYEELFYSDLQDVGLRSPLEKTFDHFLEMELIQKEVKINYFYQLIEQMVDHL
jgi:hypothetical protein